MAANGNVVLKLDSETECVLRDASMRAGESLEAFIIGAAIEKMLRLEAGPRTTYLSERDWNQLLEAFDSDEEPNERLKRAMRRYNELKGH